MGSRVEGMGRMGSGFSPFGNKQTVLLRGPADSYLFRVVCCDIPSCLEQGRFLGLQVGFKVRVQCLIVRVPYYFGDLKRDPN